MKFALPKLQFVVVLVVLVQTNVHSWFVFYIDDRTSLLLFHHLFGSDTQWYF